LINYILPAAWNSQN